MTALPLVGDPTSALAHFAPLGLTSILRDAGDRSARFRWDADDGRAFVETDLDETQVANRVIRHAVARTEDSWLTATIWHESRRGTSLFSPRVKAAGTLEDWKTYVDERHAWLVEHGEALTALDTALLGALGEPAWWRCNPKEVRPDDGASRWEMKTRNRGEEFFANRLVPLTGVVARRSSSTVLAGLRGESVMDELGKGSVDSRTSTGLTVPGVVDSACAYVALWGLSAMRTVHRSSAISASAGMWPRRGVHPTYAFLPVFTQSITPTWFGSTAATRQFDVVGRRLAGDSGVSGGAGEEVWLREQGVHAVAVFPIKKTGSSSAPERQLLTGELIVL